MSADNGYTGYGVSPYEQPPSPGEQSSPKIFIGGLSPSVTSEGLISHFCAYGEVIDATIMNDKITGRPRGFGFVTFRNPDAVDALLQESHVLDGKQVECKRAVPMGYLDGKPGGGPPGGPPQGGRAPMNAPGGPSSYGGGAPAGNTVATSGRYNPEKIFVGGLPISCDDSKLREYFSKYGVIVDAVVMIDRDLQRHRGFGYVLFQDAGAVDGAVADHEAHQIDGKWVDVKRCVVQESAGWPQSGPMRKGFGGKGMTPPIPGVSASMPGYYGQQPGRSGMGGYGGADYGTSQYYGGANATAASSMGKGGYGARGGKGAPMPTAGGYGMTAGGYMTNAYGAQPSYGYGVAPADPYASSGYGAASPYGAMPGYTSTGYAGYGAPAAGYGQPPSGGNNQYAGYMPQGQQPPTSAGSANPNDLYAASRRSGYRTSPY